MECRTCNLYLALACIPTDQMYVELIIRNAYVNKFNGTDCILYLFETVNKQTNMYLAVYSTRLIDTTAMMMMLLLMMV